MSERDGNAAGRLTSKRAYEEWLVESFLPVETHVEIVRRLRLHMGPEDRMASYIQDANALIRRLKAEIGANLRDFTNKRLLKERTMEVYADYYTTT